MQHLLHVVSMPIMLETQTNTTAVIYCRISSDRTGTGLGVKRQLDDCRALCEKQGFTIVGEHTDNDISAFSGKHRPGYAAVCQTIEQGQADVVVAWHFDRLQRNPRELEDFVDLLEKAKATVATCTDGGLDLATVNGRSQARIIGAMARAESEHKSERIKRKHLELAQAGAAVGSGRPFGYELGKMKIRESEAVLIREAVADVIAGRPIGAIAAEWDKRGVPTVKGAHWQYHTLANILTSARIAGLRSHHGKVVAKGVWPAIVDVDQWEICRAVIAQKRAQRTGTRAPRKHLLTGGIAVCGVCGRGLSATGRTLESRGRVAWYQCTARPGEPKCGAVKVETAPVDAFVIEALFAAVDAGGVDALMGSPAQVDETNPVAVVADIEQRLAQLADLFADGDLTKLEWQRSRERLAARLKDAQALVQADRVPSPAAPYMGRTGALQADWEGLDLGIQKAIISAVIETVSIARLGNTARGSERGAANAYKRITIKWRA